MVFVLVGCFHFSKTKQLLIACSLRSLCFFFAPWLAGIRLKVDLTLVPCWDVFIVILFLVLSVLWLYIVVDG